MKKAKLFYIVIANVVQLEFSLHLIAFVIRKFIKPETKLRCLTILFLCGNSKLRKSGIFLAETDD